MFNNHTEAFIVGLMIGGVCGYFVGDESASSGKTILKERVAQLNERVEELSDNRDFCTEELKETNREIEHIKNLNDKTNNELQGTMKGLDESKQIIEGLREDIKKTSKDCDSTIKSKDEYSSQLLAKIQTLKENIEKHKLVTIASEEEYQRQKVNPLSNSDRVIKIDPSQKKYEEFTLKPGVPWSTPDHSGLLVISQIHETYIIAEITDKNRSNQDMRILKGVEFNINGKSGVYSLMLVKISYNAAKFRLSK